MIPRIAGQAWYRLRGPGREALLRADGESPAALVDAVPDATVRAALALRDALVLGLSALGTALCITSCAVAWRVLVPRRRRPDRPAPVASAATAGEGGR